MKLLAVISHKGGAGKTTSAVMLAEELAERGYRVLLIDADRQHSAGLLLDVASSEERVQETRVSNLDYFASGRLTELDVEERYAELAGSYHVGVVDTPSLDDALARAWLSESDAALVVLQVEPLTMKTMHGALATIETVRRVNPRIQVLGLLPTMFDATQETHRVLLAELTQRRRDSLFPAIPNDSGLMHRAGMSWAAQVSAAARDAYWAVADRIVATMDLSVGAAADHSAPIAHYGAPAHDQRAGLVTPPRARAVGATADPRRPATEYQRPATDTRHPTPDPWAPSADERSSFAGAAKSRADRQWGRMLAPFALGVVAALLVLALAMGPLRTRLFGPPGQAYAVTTGQSGSGASAPDTDQAEADPAAVPPAKKTPHAKKPATAGKAAKKQGVSAE